MPENINITQTNNLLPFISYFDSKGIEWKSAARLHNIPEDIDVQPNWVPTHQVMAFLMAMMRESKKRIGIEVGGLITLEQISPELHQTLSNCHDLGDALHKLIEIMPTLNSHVMVWVENIQDQWFLCHRGAYHPSTIGFDQAEWFRSFALLSMCRMFIGEAWQPQQVWMSSAEHLSSKLPATFDNTEFLFEKDYGAIAINLPSNFVPIDRQTLTTDWLDKVEQLIATYAVLPWFNIDWFVKLIGTSSRSLQRQLHMRCTSFRTLRDQARCRSAKVLLTQGQLTPFETAWQCGYNDLSNFNRAFKAWTGQTPAQYRNGYLASAR
ncbi:AraC family transcriptional regulator [Vibrio owensii]|uniref:helix-turn-helix domain-containing protein n=1 Tax=Vibrio owensii TaxID=696485 RepID=UPI003397AC7A